MLDLRPDLRSHFPGDEPAVFDRIMNLEGQLFRSLAGRKTLRFTLDGKGYFAKLALRGRVAGDFQEPADGAPAGSRCPGRVARHSSS